MKLAFFTSIGMPWGGSEILWTSAAREALKQKHDVLVSVFAWPQQHASIEALKFQGANLLYRRRFYPNLPTRIKKKILNYFLPIGKKYTYHDYLNIFKADHIFFNLAGGDEIATDATDLMVFVRQSEIPFSVFYHSLSPNRYLTDANSENFRFVLQKAKYNFFTSQMQINLLQQQLDCRIDNAFILNHPLRNIKSERSVGTEKIGFNFCIIGSLVTRWKGQDIAINILSKERWRYLNWHLNLYGEGPDREALVKLISEKNISHKVTLYGQINDVNKLYADNDLVLIPSKQDSGPIVMFEAMLAAKPIVGSYMGAMPEYIQTGMNGVLAEAADEDSFEKAMESAWNQRDEWATWGRNAKIYLQQRYDFSPAQTLINFLINSH